MSPWGWRPERTEGVWRHGAPCLKPLVAIAPWITVGLLLLLFWLLDGTLVATKGFLFDLPRGAGIGEDAASGPVALIVPAQHETFVFFDDSRYVLSEASSCAALGAQFAELTSATGPKTIVALTDRRVSCEDLLKFTDLARKHGIAQVLFAEQKASGDE